MPIDNTLVASIEFHGLWIMAGNDAGFGTLLILKPVYKKN